MLEKSAQDSDEVLVQSAKSDVATAIPDPWLFQPLDIMLGMLEEILSIHKGDEIHV